MKKVSPALALLLLGPICGELISGHQTLFEFINPLAFIISSLPYGFGAVICRELMIRWHKGWISLVLLGIAYGIYEEFIVARSVWDPEWAELGAIRDYSYWQGVTWTYAEILIHFHLTISILSSILLAHLLFSDQRRQSWVNNWQLIVCFVGLALWIPVLWLLNPFVPSIFALLFSGLAIGGLAVLAWALPAQLLPLRSGTDTHPFRYGVLGAVNMTVSFATVFILPEANPSWLPGWPVSFIFVAVLDLLTFGLILYWSGNGYAWDDRHKLALLAGWLSFFIVFDFFQDFERFGGLSLVAIAGVWGLYLLWHRTQARLVDI